MATEKIQVTAHADANPYAKETSEFGSEDAELQVGDSPPVELSSTDILEVRLLLFDQLGETDRVRSEVH